jgi:CRP-like cAMP-binding protein
MILPNRSEFRRRDLLPLRQDYLWNIESGYVRSLSLTEDGDVVTLGIWGAGEVIGKTFTVLECYQLECLTPVRITPFIADAQATQTAYLHYLQQTEMMLSLVHVRSIAARLLKVLQWLSLRFGYSSPQGWILNVPLTHQTLAELIGTTRVTVTRTLSEFSRSGQIQLLKRHQILFPGFNPKLGSRVIER